MKNDLLSDVFYCLLASITAFILVPIFMIGNSPEDYRFVDYIVFFKTGVVFSLLLGVLLSVICVIFHLLKLHNVAKYISFFSLLWVLVAGFFIPVSISTGMVDPESNPVDKYNLFFSIIVAMSLSLAGLTVARKYIQAFIVVVIITSILPALFSIYSSGVLDPVNEGEHPSLTLSNKKNILVISFDGLPGYIISDLIKGDKEYSEAFKDFIIFNNVISQSPATQASQIGELFGVRDYKSMGERRSDVMEFLTTEGVTDKLLINQVPDSYQYGYINVSAKSVNILTPEQLAQQKIDTFDFFRYPIARLWTAKFFYYFDWQSKTKELQTYILNPDESYDVVLRLKNHVGAQWDKPYILQMPLYNEYVERLSSGNKEFSLRYLHFVFTHFPVDFDEGCNYRSDDKEWYEAHQNEDGLRSQSKCAVDLFLNFLDKLKELDIYNNSLIVFKSDHGEPSVYFSETPNNLTINGPSRWGYNRYRPTLMIKDFAAVNSEVHYKEELVLLNDLARTLCESSGLHLECESFPGLNLFSDRLESDDPYYLYVVRDAKSSYKFNDHMSVTIPSRKLSLLNALKGSDLIVTKSQENNPSSKMAKRSQLEFKKRLSDIEKIKKSLTEFYSINSEYPVSNGWSGIYTDWGVPTPKYINGLVPEFLASLPVDPRNSKDGDKNYLYMSDGKDFKFIVHGAPSYDMAFVDKKLIDSQRPTWAYGVWTQGAKDW